MPRTFAKSNLDQRGKRFRQGRLVAIRHVFTLAEIATDSGHEVFHSFDRSARDSGISQIFYVLLLY
jgi:hypothetical protein